jgi:hypothetical protein
MNPDQVQELRQKLKLFLGLDQYRRFISTLPKTAEELFFWQEKLWNEFTSRHPQFASLKHADIKKSLKICSLHESEFETQERVVSCGRIGLSKEYLAARDEFFPFAQHNLYDCKAEIERYVQVECCRQCCDVRESWMIRTPLTDDHKT